MFEWVDMTTYDRYSDDVEIAANEMVLKKAITTDRKGAARTRDRIVFGKFSWQEALSYMAIIQSAVIFMALIPQAIYTVNETLEWFGIPYQFPVHISSVVAIVFIIIVFIFGLVAVRYIGTIKRSNEITSKMNPGLYAIWRKLAVIERDIGKIEKDLGEKKKRE